MRDSAEPEVDCPVPIETLNALSRADNASVLETVRPYPEERRVRLALYCYNRAHLRKLALTIASSVDPARLGEIAGTMGEVLASQCQANDLSFGTEPIEPVRLKGKAFKEAKPKPKISLGGLGFKDW